MQLLQYKWASPSQDSGGPRNHWLPTAGSHLEDNCHLNCLGLMSTMVLDGRMRAASGKVAEGEATQLPHPNDSMKSYYSKLSIKQYAMILATQWG